jgi:hypothetical protein
MLRALTIFLLGVIVVLVFGAFARDVVGLGCVGPVLPAWGCLSEPLPDTIPGNLGMLWYLFLAGVGFAICYVVKDAVYLIAGFAGRHLFPRLARTAPVELDPTQTQRGYRIR